MKSIMLIVFLMGYLSPVCLAEEKVIVLSQYENVSYSDMLKELGPPIDKTGYTIKDAPTKSWNHSELFAKYPKNKKNKDIQIMEVAWDAGDYVIFACYHRVHGENRCLVAKKVKIDVRF